MLSDQEQIDEDDLSPTSLPTDVPGTLVHFESDNDDEDSASDPQDKPKKRGRQRVNKKGSVTRSGKTSAAIKKSSDSTR
jgi:hypothetical protein